MLRFDVTMMGLEQRLEVVRDGVEAVRVLRGVAPARPPRDGDGGLARRRLRVGAPLQRARAGARVGDVEPRHAMLQHQLDAVHARVGARRGLGFTHREHQLAVRRRRLCGGGAGRADVWDHLDFGHRNRLDVVDPGERGEDGAESASSAALLDSIRKWRGGRAVVGVCDGHIVVAQVEIECKGLKQFFIIP